MVGEPYRLALSASLVGQTGPPPFPFPLVGWPCRLPMASPCPPPLCRTPGQLASSAGLAGLPSPLALSPSVVRPLASQPRSPPWSASLVGWAYRLALSSRISRYACHPPPSTSLIRRLCWLSIGDLPGWLALILTLVGHQSHPPCLPACLPVRPAGWPCRLAFAARLALLRSSPGPPPAA